MKKNLISIGAFLLGTLYYGIGLFLIYEGFTDLRAYVSGSIDSDGIALNVFLIIIGFIICLAPLFKYLVKKNMSGHVHHHNHDHHHDHIQD